MAVTPLPRSFNPRRYTVNADRGHLAHRAWAYIPNHWDDPGLPDGAQIGDHAHLALWWHSHTPPR